jgi:predicted dithiol-disulfide oxidoreductase (DUF899 family)
MADHEVVSREDWLAARSELLQAEKEFTRLRDQLSQERRALPWVKVDKAYMFESSHGQESLVELFDGRSQLIIYHFMYGPDWAEGCPSCSFWADSFNGIGVHLEHRDITLIAVSRAPLPILDAYKTRMGWDFKWVSSFDSDFNYDYHVSFTPDEMEQGEAIYNYHVGPVSVDELPGVSVFYQDEAGDIFHTYSAYARGVDMINGAYQFMDLAPRGRDEDDLPYNMAWLRRHDQYED